MGHRFSRSLPCRYIDVPHQYRFLFPEICQSQAQQSVTAVSYTHLLKLTNKAVVEALDGLPPVKIHCSVLAEQAVKSALADYYRRHGVDPEPIVGKIEEDCHACSLSLIHISSGCSRFSLSVSRY